MGAIPFDIPNVELTHYGERCTFDTLVEKYKVTDPAVITMSVIVRGADTDRHELAEQASGLWAISAGLAYNYTDDLELLEKGMLLYDALYSWAKHLQKEKHTEQPFENRLLNVIKLLKPETGSDKKIPEWAQEIKEIIQDHIGSNITLKEISKDLNNSPSYLSREFSKYFGDLSFGEYIQKQRIEKAKELMGKPAYTLTEIAYLTGFSEQSHFTRIFNKITVQNPSDFRRKSRKK